MSDLALVSELSRKALIVTSVTGNVDDSLWDCAKRLVLNVQSIANLPEIVEAGFQIDQFCLTTAAYFNYAAEACQLSKSGELKATDVKNTTNLQNSAEIAEKILCGHIDSTKIDKINRILVESFGNFTHMTEDMMLSEARNLAEMGAAGLFCEIKRYGLMGKSVNGAMETWQRKVDYQYWQARLQENFRFKSVRRLAEQRLNITAGFMKQLEIEIKAQDIKEAAATLVAR